jgi:uncharacterized alkaline shock family protein YloU
MKETLEIYDVNVSVNGVKHKYYEKKRGDELLQQGLLYIPEGYKGTAEEALAGCAHSTEGTQLSTEDSNNWEALVSLVKQHGKPIQNISKHTIV